MIASDTTRVIVLTARFPPMRSSGTRRIEALRRHLPDHGIDPVFVCPPLPGIDAAPDMRVVGDDHTVCRALTKVPLVRRAHRHLAVPDDLHLWAEDLRTAREVESFDAAAVYATGPPFSANVAAAAVADRLGLPSIQEFRDPPSFRRPLRGRATSFVTRMTELEGRLLRDAAATITVTPRTRARLLELHPDVDASRVHVVTNGYPEVEIDTSLARPRSDDFTFTYVGSVVGDIAGPSSPLALLPTLAATGAGRVRLVGPLTEQQRQVVATHDHRDLLDVVGQVDRATALAEVRTADAVLVAAHADDDWWIGRKVFESLAYARRVLAIAPDGDTADLLARSPKARLVHPGDVSDLRRAVDEVRLAPPVDHVPEDLQTDEACVAGIAHVIRGVLPTTSRQPSATEGTDGP